MLAELNKQRKSSDQTSAPYLQLPAFDGRIINQRQSNPLPVSDSQHSGGFIKEEMTPDPDQTAGPETGRGQGVATETHSHLTAMCHRGRWSPAS